MYNNTSTPNIYNIVLFQVILSDIEDVYEHVN